MVKHSPEEKIITTTEDRLYFSNYMNDNFNSLKGACESAFSHRRTYICRID